MGRARADTVQAWVAEVLGWDTTTSELGRSRTSSDGLNNYLMLSAKWPRRFGAFAYVTPGNAKVTLRLLAKDAEGYQHATIRKVEKKKGTGYEVTVLLDSDEAYQEALGLASSPRPCSVAAKHCLIRRGPSGGRDPPCAGRVRVPRGWP